MVPYHETLHRQCSDRPVFWSHLHRSGVLTVGAVYLIIHYTELLGRPIRMLVQQVQSLQEIGANVARVGELFSTRSRINDPRRRLSSAT